MCEPPPLSRHQKSSHELIMCLQFTNTKLVLRPEVCSSQTCITFVFVIHNRMVLQRAGAACAHPLKGGVWSSLPENASDRKDSFSTATGAHIDRAHQPAPTYPRQKDGGPDTTLSWEAIGSSFVYCTRCTYWVRREMILGGFDEEWGGAWQKIIRDLGREGKLQIWRRPDLQTSLIGAYRSIL